MNITLVSTFRNKGGAAIACSRLKTALNNQQTDVELLSQEGLSYWQQKVSKFCLARDILYTANALNDSKYRFAFSPARFGINIAQHPMIQRADIIHLHWINQGFLSLNSIEALANLQKPIVWTLHDMWAFTGGCHHSRTCTQYKQDCSDCWYLIKQRYQISERILQRKKEIFNQMNLHIITCSNWLGNCARQSSLLENKPIHIIPNALDTDLYNVADSKQEAKRALNLPENKFIIAMSAFNISDERKGFQYLKTATEYLLKQHPELKEKIHFLLVGLVKNPEVIELPVPFTCSGYITEEQKMVEIYKASDIFVLPSLEENLPNTIMEAMACGTPALAFDVGGISDLIDHKKNGYLAKYLSYEDLSEGLWWLYNCIIKDNRLQQNAHKKVSDNFSYNKISEQHIAIYRNILT